MNEKRERILEAAIRLFATEGISVPTARIAKEGGVSNGTLFNNFSTKQELIDEVYLYIKHQLAEQILPDTSSETTPKEAFFSMWNGFIRWAIAHPLFNSTLALLHASGAISLEVSTKVENIFKPIKDKLALAQEQNEILNTPINFLLEIGAAQMNAAIDYACREELHGEDLNKHIELTFAIYWTGIAQ